MDCAGESDCGSGRSPWDFLNLRFPGQYFDAETGLHYNRFRYYDPSIGRYISADPIGQFGLLAQVGVLPFTPGNPAFPGPGANLYTYVLNNPLMNRPGFSGDSFS